MQDIRTFIQLATNGEPALIITYKALKAAFEGIPFVEVAHFNAVAGLDRWRHVRHVFIIGRPLPPAEEVRVMTAALTARPIAAVEPHIETRGICMADGTGWPIDMRAYEDADMEAVRAAITDAEVMQAVGRPRGINRTAETPVTT
ncbi:MAG: hypothetical protein JO122_05900 [Acetobacteraceae bacterium]|nr:hypothetical protein [Acetobacteraceae bacterium]